MSMDEFLKYKEEIVRLRRDFHMHPELGFEEQRTLKIVEEYLKELGIKTKRMATTGVVGYLDNGGNITIALRADMDALPIQEENDVPYKSRYPGKMHACGHDAHTAMLLVAAKILSQRKLKGNVRFLFQPAEEGLNGAKRMIDDGALKGVDKIIGLHVWAELPSKVIAISPGPIMASVDHFKIIIRGKGGHGASPHQTNDPILCASSLITSLQSIVSRNISPLESAVVTVGKISGGTAFNIIPENVEMEGTVRTFSEEVRSLIERRLGEIVKHHSLALGCRGELIYKKLNSATVNDEELAQIGKEVASKITRVVEQKKTMGGEDFSEYARIIPGLFVYLGIRNEEKGIIYPHHNPRFNIDEDALPYGTAFEVLITEKLLNS